MLVKGVPDRKWAPATDLPLSAIFCLMAETIWHIYMTIHQYRADSKLAPSQWEMSLQINTVSHWLGANPRISTHSNSTHAVSVVFGTQVTVELACMLPISMAPIWRHGICNNHGKKQWPVSLKFTTTKFPGYVPVLMHLFTPIYSETCL